MSRMSDESRKRLEEAVLLCCAMLEGSSMLKRLHMTRPDPFVTFVEKYIPMHHELRGKLVPGDLDADLDGRLRIIGNTLRRLNKQDKIKRDSISVPVLQNNGSGGKHIVYREMPYYVPTSVLDKLARC